jgi:hypothetical protein
VKARIVGPTNGPHVRTHPDANESVEMKRLIMRPNALYKIRVQVRNSGVIAHLEKNDATDAEAIYQAGYGPDDALPSGQVG